MGERSAPTEAEIAMRRHRLRIRTVAVSFVAAARSVHRDHEISAAERDALIETWRVWAMNALDGYARDAAQLIAEVGFDEAERQELAEHMDRGYAMVRDA